MVYHWHNTDGVLRASPAERRELGLGSRVARLRDRVLELAGRPPALPALEGPVSRDDGWGLAVLGWLGVIEDWPPGAAALLEHCATARTPRPGPRWDKTGRQRLDGVAGPGALLRRLLDTMLSAEPVSYLTDSGPRTLLVGLNEQLIKGVAWAAGLLDPPWLPQVLGAVAERCLRLCSGHVFGNTAVQGEKIPYACFRALVASGSDASLLALARTGQATSNGSVLKNLAKALQEAASRRGTSPASLLDRLTPDHGIGADGQVSIGTEDGRWTIRLDDRDGAVASGPPAPSRRRCHRPWPGSRRPSGRSGNGWRPCSPDDGSGTPTTSPSATSVIRWPAGSPPGWPGRSSRRTAARRSAGSPIPRPAASGPRRARCRFPPAASSSLSTR
jgi:hypothetical protein